MKISGLIWVLLLCIPTDPSIAQTFPKVDIDMESFVEELFSVQEEEINYEDLYESLLQVYLNPLDLNKTNTEELHSLYILSPSQINHLIQYREKFGPLLSVYELQAVPEFDLGIIYRLLPFVKVDAGEENFTGSLSKRFLGDPNAYFIFRKRRIWETRKGYTPPDTLSGGRLATRYMGGPNEFYARFRVQHAQDFSWGFTLDKDAGEEFRWDPTTKRYGFNFFSYHFTLYQKGKWKTITLGDFQAQFGQGLVFGSGYAAGKGAETITTVRRGSLGIRPYTSVMEFGYFRGGAFTYSLGKIEFSALFSHAPRDGNIQTVTDTLENQEDYIRSILLSGYHRTPSEIENKSQARETNLGANIHYKSLNKMFQLGYNGLYTDFGLPFIKAERLYNAFEFRGKTNHINSTYFSLNYQNFFFFGETAITKSGGRGSIIGLMSSLSSQIDLSLLWRNYGKDFHSFYGNAFSEGSRPINEKGIYLGLQYRPSRKFYWSGYYDRFYFPWLRFRAYAPSQGHEWLNRFTYTPNRNLMFFFQVREENKDRNIPLREQKGPGYQLATGRKRNFVTSLDFDIDKKWHVKSRIQFSSFFFNGLKTKGYSIHQDLSGDWEKFRLHGRIALFDTDDYENRQYMYERNVLWAFSIPHFSGQGMRYYLLGQYNLSKKLTFWARWARTSFTDRQSIGTGLQTITGPTMTETTFQLRYQFNR